VLYKRDQTRGTAFPGDSKPVDIGSDFLDTGDRANQSAKLDRVRMCALHAARFSSAIPSAISPSASVTIPQVTDETSFALSPAFNENTQARL
jgi:hypothetical protein